MLVADWFGSAPYVVGHSGRTVESHVLSHYPTASYKSWWQYRVHDRRRKLRATPAIDPAGHTPARQVASFDVYTI